MGAHLYVCDSSGPMVVATDGKPPRWVTCPACSVVECCCCKGAKLEGDAPGFSAGSSMTYRCEAGHTARLQVPDDTDLPESASCPECDGMMLPVAN